jgi:hypothetical protein
MSQRIFLRGMTLLVSVGLLLTLCTAPSLAQEKIKVAGTHTMAQATRDTLSVGNTAGHVLTLQRSTGTNASSGATKFLDGAQMVTTSFSDLVNGNGPHQGYSVVTQDGNSIFTEWRGSVTTAPGEKEPLISFEGTFRWTGGTGEYAKIMGSGTYKGHFTSKTTYTVDWTGEYSLAK